MQAFIYSKNLKLLITPAIWVVIMLAVQIFSATQYGRSGHPSISTITFIYMSFLSPLFGIVGLLHIKIKAKNKSKLKTISTIMNSGIILYGAYIILLWKGVLNA